MNWSIKNCWYLNSIDILLNSSSNISTKLPNIMNWSQIYGWVWIKNPTQQTHVERQFLMAFLIFPSQNVILVFRTKPRPVNVSFKVSGSGGTSWNLACFGDVIPKVGNLDDDGRVSSQIFSFFYIFGGQSWKSPTFFAPKQIGWMDLYDDDSSCLMDDF